MEVWVNGNEIWWKLTIESVYALLSLWSRHVAIDTLKMVAKILQKVFQDVQQASHLIGQLDITSSMHIKRPLSIKRPPERR